MKLLLFVCTANICRSPLAEWMTREKLASHPNLSEWRVMSAGTWGNDGEPICPQVTRLLAKRGIDASAHRALIITEPLLSRSDLVLTMEKGQAEALRVEFPAQQSKIFSIGSFLENDLEIKDPVKQPFRKFKKLEKQFETTLNDILTKLSG
ncbi:MAG: hypothetical protein JW750_08135 [Anaerolineaceae bacterium]|nr:hypothetical protein [Anaerolineaceae bacterium]